MPIRVNLLAEAQTAEDLRRRDPVKRALWVGGVLLGAMILWCGVLQARVLAAHSRVKTLQARWQQIEKDNHHVVDNRRRTIEIEKKLAHLEQLNTNRFLWGSALNALQQTLSDTEAIQVVRIKSEQSYVLSEEPAPKGRTNGVGKPPKPATATEKITMFIEAMDSSGQAGAQVNKYKEGITGVPFFADMLQKTNVLLTTLSPPQTPTSGGGPYVLFTLQCSFPEKVRQ